jgi:hypothetical protein
MALFPIASDNTDWMGSYYEIGKAQYLWKVNSDPNLVVLWDLQFTPYNNIWDFAPIGPVQHTVISWATQGATQSPVYTIDPTQLNNKENGEYSVVPIQVTLSVDANRDGYIDIAGTTDQTTQSKPYRFWINNDDDAGSDYFGGSPILPSSTTQPTSNPDWQNNTIVSIRDLDNWTRLWINMQGINSAITSGTIKVGLKWNQVTRGTPGIKLATATDSDGGLEYLANWNSASNQISEAASGGGKILQSANDQHTNIVPSGAAVDFVFPVSTWAKLSEGAPTTHFLFEGSGEGTGQLQIVFLKSDGQTVTGQGGSVWLDLRDIKEMYTRAVASPQPPTPYSYVLSQPPTPSMSYTIDTSNVSGTSGTFLPDPNEDTSNPTYIVFTHGFNQSYVSFLNYGETTFKRLWQLGYRGRFATYRWPTYGSGWSLAGYTLSAIGIYNDCEYIAWYSGGALNQFTQSLSGQGYNIDMMSHSLGSVVVGEALHEGMQVQYYSMTHAAASASLYSWGASYYAITNPNPYAFDNDPDAATSSLAYSGSTATGYNGYLGQINGNVTGGSIVNFYDENDSAITTWWTTNNLSYKPQSILGGVLGQYNYDSAQPSGQKLEFGWILDHAFYDSRYVTQHGEAKAYIDQSLTGSIGSNTAFKGSIQAQGINEDAMGTDHSYEWDNPIEDPTTFSFYNALMGSYDLTPISIPTNP